ncbi:cell division protein FtsQ/DivIB [Lactobacillus sp. PV034]|uniref:cell division protein FtsQ/DivIB n=1 Tax=Lactobacillus sp. PV034 TaxID=2594495 RepID=UPI0022407CA4|nr:cell division protein FtsQ/DivIB [Lactobacillus sp. PV034]QNQ80607.1 FtsQ-type POTRA domain-containing protein [Lactobacillus sp. PV034]
MPKKKITKKDPNEEISGWIRYKQNDQANNSKKKVSASLNKLQAERRKSLTKRLGIIIAICVIGILSLSYYVSAKANIASVQIKGASELNGNEVVKASGITAQDKVIPLLLKNKDYSLRLQKRFPEVESVSLHVNHLNNLVLNVKEKPVIGYIKEDNGYRKILNNGKVASQIISDKQINPEKPLFIGYNKSVSLVDDLDIYAKLPKSIQKQVKIMSGRTKRSTQIILVMKDNNVIIGNTTTINNKIKYYPEIKKQLSEPSIVDLEIGAFSRPLSASEKAKLGIK